MAATPETTVERIAHDIDTISGNLPERDSDPDFDRWVQENAGILTQLRENLEKSTYADRAIIAKKMNDFNQRLKEKIAQYGVESDTKKELRKLQQFVESRTPTSAGAWTTEKFGGAAGQTTDFVFSTVDDARAIGTHEYELWQRSDWGTRIGRLGMMGAIGLGTYFAGKKILEWTEGKGFFRKLFRFVGLGALAIGVIKLANLAINPREQLAKLDPVSYGHYASPSPPRIEMPAPAPEPPAPKSPASGAGAASF